MPSPLKDFVILILTISDGEGHTLRHTNPDVVYSAMLHGRRIGASYGLQMGIKLSPKFSKYPIKCHL